VVRYNQKNKVEPMTGTDLMWLAINAYHEARGETFEGQVAVCHVVLNRAAGRRKTVKETVLAPMQFSWANGGTRPAIKDYVALESGMKAADQAANKERPRGDNLQGADHYYADYIDMPSWAKGMKQVAKIGRHIFYRS